MEVQAARSTACCAGSTDPTAAPEYSGPLRSDRASPAGALGGFLLRIGGLRDAEALGLGQSQVPAPGGDGGHALFKRNGDRFKPAPFISAHKAHQFLGRL